MWGEAAGAGGRQRGLGAADTRSAASMTSEHALGAGDTRGAKAHHSLAAGAAAAGGRVPKPVGVPDPVGVPTALAGSETAAVKGLGYHRATGGATRVWAPAFVLLMGEIWREAGVRGLFRGISINYIRVVPMVAVSFTSYDLLKDWLGVSGASKPQA